MLKRRGLLQICISMFAAGLPRSMARDSGDPWKPDELMEAGDLARRIGKGDGGIRIVCVGFAVLYKQWRIAGAEFAGPGSKAEGIAALGSAVEHWRRDEVAVIYCGCCPMTKCPNIRPAYAEMKRLGFTNLRVLNLPSSFHTDWRAKGYPVAGG